MDEQMGTSPRKCMSIYSLLHPKCYYYYYYYYYSDCTMKHHNFITLLSVSSFTILLVE